MLGLAIKPRPSLLQDLAVHATRHAHAKATRRDTSPHVARPTRDGQKSTARRRQQGEHQPARRLDTRPRRPDSKAPMWRPSKTPSKASTTRSSNISAVTSRTPTRFITDPFDLAPRLLEIYRKEGKANALEELSKANTDAKAVPVYNLLIRELLKDGHIDDGYACWMSMKRQGLVPTPQSYTVFFSSIVAENLTRSGTEKVNTIWKQWQRFLEQPGVSAPLASPERKGGQATLALPTNAYIRLLSRQNDQDVDRLIHVLDTMPAGEPRQASKEAFTVMFQTLIRHVKTIEPDSEQARRLVETSNDVWARSLSSAQSGSGQLDGRLISAAAIAYRVLSSFLPGHYSQEAKAKLLHELESIMGLGSDSTKANASAAPEFDSKALYDTMALASLFEGRHSQHVIRWYTTVRDDPKFSGLSSPQACELYMKAAPQHAVSTLVAMIRSRAFEMRPEVSTYTACMAVSSYIDQLRILAHITGQDDLLEASEPRLLQSTESTTGTAQSLSKRSLEKGYHTKRIQPTAKMVAIHMQTALHTQDRRRIARALDTIKRLGGPGFTRLRQTEKLENQDPYIARLRDMLRQASEKVGVGSTTNQVPAGERPRSKASLAARIPKTLPRYEARQRRPR